LHLVHFSRVATNQCAQQQGTHEIIGDMATDGGL
jgi:hypothetical protein